MRLKKIITSSLALFAGMLFYTLPTAAQITILGPSEVNAGTTGMYSVDYGSSTCSGAGTGIYTWTAQDGLLSTSTSCSTAAVIKAAKTNPDARTDTSSTADTSSGTNATISPDTNLPVGGNECPHADVSWGDYTTITHGYVQVTDKCGASYMLYVTIVPPMNASSCSISPASQSVVQNGTPIALTLSGSPTGGDGTYHYQWQSSSDNSNWSNISGATATSYTPTTDIQGTTYYRLEIYSFDYTAYTSSVTVTVALSIGGIISVSSPVVMHGTGTVTLSGTSADVSCSGNIYQWEESPDEINWTVVGTTSTTGTSIANVSTTTYFRRKVTCLNSSGYSNTVRVKVIPSVTTIIPNTAIAPPASTATSIPMPAYGTGIDPNNMNYIKTRDFVAPGISTLSSADGQTSTNVVHQSTEYYDGLGRPVQTVAMQSTPGNHDLISTTFYDAFGRVAQQYLPYTDEGTSGGFRTNANTEQPAFYNSKFSNTEGYYYSNTQYEPSPLNRVLKTTAPGNSWTGHDVGTGYVYRTNDEYDSVRIWTIDSTEDALPATSASYDPGVLYVTETTDENGNETIEYKDPEGQVVLKKTEISDAINPGHSGWLCTYYVYDDLNNLRFVIPPDAVNWLEANNWTFSSSGGNQVATNLCFSYLYDGRRRMIMKQVPDGGKTYMVYDLRNRVVFTQDSTQRTANEWFTTFYDALNRPVMTALYPSSSSRAALQAMLDNTSSYTISEVIYTNNSPAPANIETNSRQWDGAPSQYTATNSITFLPGFTSSANDNFTASINPSAQITTTDTLFETAADNPVPNITGYTPLTYTYYDNYSWGGAQSFDNSQVARLNAGSNPNPYPVAASYKTRGRVTGTKVRVLNTTTEQWLTTTLYYDDKGRLIQSLTGNITGAIDELTTQYDFAGKVLSTYLDHKNARSAATPEVTVLTMNSYDAGGRLLSITKELNNDPTTERAISTYAYNELGQLVKKTLSSSFGGAMGVGLDTLHYDYNIRGWLNGINKPYVNSSTTLTPGPGHYFGTELDYDYGFNQAQVNGNIAGEKWKDAGDGDERAYGFNYDNANRILKADFTQDNSGAWNNTLGSGNIDFSVKNLAYDANGNIQSMKQMGLKVNNSAAIDELNYKYNTNSNQLFSVTDTIPPPPTGGGAGGGLGDFNDGANAAGTADYSYDGNGNLTEDLNKNIANIHYNYLNLPDSITVSNKGTIQFVYDATGNKLEKIVTDNTVGPAKTTTTDYIDGFEYQSSSPSSGGGQGEADTLQFFPTEEGRVRYIPADSTIPASFVYDYFIKDHLGNIRMVLTEQTKEDLYAATMEPQNATNENKLFDNISSTTMIKPTPGFDNDANNKDVSQLDGSAGNDSQPRVGPSIVLKVMAGDTITIGTYAWYQGPIEPPPSGALPLLNDLLNALTGGVISNSHSLYNTTDNNPNTVLSGDLSNFFTTDENTNYSASAPKAFLNYVAFDNQLNEVSANSGVVQVPTITGSEQAQPLVAPQQIIQKDGYIYIYVSNESAQKVYFDNLVIHHNRGPILQTDSYYPFGLTMAGISDQAALSLENNYKFNGIELNHKEFSDGSGLELYTAKFRGLDPQIGRWWQIDPKPDYSQSPYAAMGDDPIFESDFLGDTSIYFSSNGQRIYTDNATKGNNEYVMRTTESTDKMYGKGNYSQKGNTNPISKQEATQAEDYIKIAGKMSNGSSININPVKNDLIKLKSVTQMKAAIKITSQDDGTEGTKAANNREYSGNFTSNGAIANPPGSVADPTKGRPATTAGVNDFHSHPSGLKRAPDGRMMGWVQPPSAQDIQVANRTEYVFGMRDNTIYIYDNTGVVATIPMGVFK